MGNNKGNITAPVSVYDVASVLGLGTGDLATLCTSDRININAKYKPIRHSSPVPLTDKKIKEMNYGIIIPNTEVLSLPDFEKFAAKTYIYDKPDGMSFKRLSDFNRYTNHGNNFISSYIDYSGYYEYPITAGIRVIITQPESNELGITDIDAFNINSLGDLYFGIAIFDTNKPTINWIVTGETQIWTDDPAGIEIIIRLNGIKDGNSEDGNINIFERTKNVTIFSFLTENKIAGRRIENSVSIYSCRMDNSDVVKMVSDIKEVVYFEAGIGEIIYAINNSRVELESIEFVLRSTSPLSGTVTKGTMKIITVTEDHDESDPIENYLVTPSFTVNMGETKSVKAGTGDLHIPFPDGNNDFMIDFYWYDGSGKLIAFKTEVIRLSKK